MNKENMIIDNEEFEAAKKEAETSKDVFTLKFKTPIKYNEEEYHTLTFDFDKLTGNDDLEIEDELTSLNIVLVAPAFSGQYLIRMAAKACKEPIGSDLIKNLPLKYYSKIRSAARSFLLKTE